MNPFALDMNENVLMLICGLVSKTPGPPFVNEALLFAGIAEPGETPYDFSTRLLKMGYGSVATVPLWRLPQFSRAWQQFLDHNRALGEK